MTPSVRSRGRVRRFLERSLPPRLRIATVRAVVRWRRRMRAPRGAGVVDLASDAQTVLVVALGVDAADLERCVASVLSARQAAAAVPLLVTDCDAFAALRASGIAFEYVPSRTDWERCLESDYDAFLERRISAITRAYGVQESVEWTGAPQLVEDALRGDTDRRHRRDPENP